MHFKLMGSVGFDLSLSYPHSACDNSHMHVHDAWGEMVVHLPPCDYMGSHHFGLFNPKILTSSFWIGFSVQPCQFYSFKTKSFLSHLNMEKIWTISESTKQVFSSNSSNWNNRKDLVQIANKFTFGLRWGKRNIRPKGQKGHFTVSYKQKIEI